MPLSYEEAYGVTAAAKKKKEEDTHFITSALAGVGSGIINIPKGIFSLGAELVDLGLGTESAAKVEQFFDTINPFDDAAEARTIGRITEAFTQIGLPAVKGAQLGVKYASSLRATNLAKRALDAKRAGKAANLSKFGRIIHKGEDILTTPVAGGVIGSGVGEALVSDEDIGTLGDMLKGTSLEPYAFTMMDTEDKEGRAEAFRKLTNRLKFGTEGALFNLGITGAAKGVKKLRAPSEFGLERWSDGFKEDIERYFTYGLKPSGPASQATFESKRTMFDAIQALKLSADNQVRRLTKAVDNVVPAADSSLDLAKASTRKEIQDILQPIPGRKLERIPLEELPMAIEEKSGIKNIARDTFEYEIKGEGAEATRRLITPEKIIGKEGQKGFFNLEDYVITPGGKTDNFLQKIRKESGKAAADEFEDIIKNMRATVDNLTGYISQKNLKVDLSKKLHAELGNYLTADYMQFNQSAIPLFRVNRNVDKIKDQALTSFKEQEKNAYRVKEAAGTGKRPEDIKIPGEKIDEFDKAGKAKIERLLKAKNLDEIDPTSQNAIDVTTGKPATNQVRRIEQNAVDIQTSVLKRKKLDEWQEIVLGRIKNPEFTFASSVSKMASLNSTLDYIDNIYRMGSKKGGSVRNVGGVEKFFNSMGDEINIGDLTKENIRKGRIKEKFYNNEGVYYSPEETFNIARKETEELLKKEFDQAQFIFGKGDVPGSEVNGAQALVDAGKAINIEEATAMLKDPKQFKYVKSTGIDGLSSLDGKWIKAPIYEAIFDTTNQFLNTSRMGAIYKLGILGPKTVSQISKTVLNALTHVRNFISAGAFVSANGLIVPTGGDYKAILPKGGKGVFGEAWQMSKQRIKGKVDPYTMNLIQRSTRVGVGGGTQVQVGEIGRTAEDLLSARAEVFTDPALAQSKANRGLLEMKERVKKWYGISQDLYVEEDNFWKNGNWLLERNRFDTAFKSLGIDETNFKDALKGKGVSTDVRNFLNDSVERFYDKSTGTFNGNYELFLDEVGGKLTRNNVPNYAYVGRFGRALRLSPFGNFIAFPLEIMRTGSNILDQSIKEMTSNIPEIAALGRKRFASFGLTVGAIPQVTAETFKAIHNVSNEEMEGLRRIVPEWSKNSTLVPRGRDKNGYLKYTDFSYSNAYDTLIRPIQAIFNSIAEGKNDAISLKASLGDGLRQGARELVEPFASESIFTEALFDSVIRDGVGKNGRRVWSEADEPFVKVVKSFGHMGKALVPMQSTFNQLVRLEKSITGRPGKYGEEFNLRDEVPGLWGFRTVQANPERSLVYKTSNFSSNLKKAENLFTSPLLRGGRVSSNDILDGYQYSESRRFHILKEMAKDIEAMKHLGMSDAKIRKEISKRRGLGKDVVNNLMLGRYVPKKPSDFFVQRMGEINRDLNKQQGVSVPNPYLISLPSINQIINQNRNLDLLNDNVNFSQLAAEGMAKGGRVGMQEGGEAGDEGLAASVWVTEPEPVKQSFEYDFNKYYRSGIWMGKVKAPEAPEAPKKPLPQTPAVDANAIKDPKVNTNVMQTGLTQTEQALLSPEEQLMRLKQRGIARA